jgi:PncC family amidohydrolase
MTKQRFSILEIGRLLKYKNLLLVTAESCSGGLLGHLITNTPGSSDYYLGGFITYSNQVKESLLGVKTETLQNFGAVSRETVIEMALGARQAMSGSYPLDDLVALSISGVAGPAGGSEAKPVGTVWIGLGGPDKTDAHLFHFDGNREQIKYQSALQALRLLFDYLNNLKQ